MAKDAKHFLKTLPNDLYFFYWKLSDQLHAKFFNWVILVCFVLLFVFTSFSLLYMLICNYMYINPLSDV